jgi:hypothetical protein
MTSLDFVTQCLLPVATDIQPGLLAADMLYQQLVTLVLLCNTAVVSVVNGPWPEGLSVSAGKAAHLDQPHRERKDGGAL